MEEHGQHETAQQQLSAAEFAAMLELPAVEGPAGSDAVAVAVRLAARLGLASVTVPPCEADATVRFLEGEQTAAAGLVGFPYGDGSTAAKLYEARDLLRRGVKEIEFVVNLGKLVSRQFQYVESELLQIARSCHENGAVFKAVIEAQRLDDELKVIASKIAKRVESDYLVVSAGGAESEQDAALLVRVSKGLCLVSSGAGTLDAALALHAMGCARIRCPEPERLISEFNERFPPPEPSPAA